MYDHRKYQLSPTGRRPSQPEIQDMNWGKSSRRKMVEVDYHDLELRVLAHAQETGTDSARLLHNGDQQSTKGPKQTSS
jgi:hypothetical protein